VLDQLLAEHGFDVRIHDPSGPLALDACDLVMYVLAQESLATTSHIFVDWVALHGPDFDQSMRRTWHERPTVLVSLGHPYYLFDAPRMPCVINAYTSIASVQVALVERLLGLAPFEGRNPVDPFCGQEEARY
jgi:beta-N-acetylhexosaminidase